jgi:hypothetical protein
MIRFGLKIVLMEEIRKARYYLVPEASTWYADIQK